MSARAQGHVSCGRMTAAVPATALENKLYAVQLSSPAAEGEDADDAPSPRVAGGSCLGPELLSQLAALGVDTAQLQRNHPADESALDCGSPAEVCKNVAIRVVFPDSSAI